nr:hypothetical protein [Tanacetum cinerariifolium]
MGDEHLDTIPATESDEVIKSSVENLVLNPSESDGENGCDVPSCFTTFSNILFDDEYEFKSVGDQSLHNEDFSEKIFSNPLFEEEIMPPSIEDDEDSEGDILFLERLLHDDPIPLPDIPDFSYEVRTFLPFFTYPVTSHVLLSIGNEDTIFDPGITVNHFYSFKPDSSHRHGTFMKFNTHRSHLNEWLTIINGKNTPLLDKRTDQSSSAAAPRPVGGLRADYGFVTTVDREIMRDPKREVGYGITDSWDEIVETLQGAPVSTDTELGGYMREFETRVRQDMDEIYMRLDDEQTERQLLAGRLNMLFRDRRAHTYTRHLMETKARMSREAWGQQGLAGGPTQPDLPEEAGTEGVASLSQWCERMESIFYISNCTVENQVKFATCTLHSVALTWWNTHVQTVGHEAAYGMSWKTLMKMMTEKYCPRNEIRKLEMELQDLKVKGLPDMIHESVVASKPKTMQEAIEIATELMDKKIHTFAKHETSSKRKFENTSRNTQNQQQQSNKWSAANTNNANNQRGPGLSQKTACYECGVQGHFKRECPKLKNNNNQGNLGGRNNAPARVLALKSQTRMSSVLEIIMFKWSCVVIG